MRKLDNGAFLFAALTWMLLPLVQDWFLQFVFTINQHFMSIEPYDFRYSVGHFIR